MHNFFTEEEAAGLVEYALIMGLVAVAVIVTMVFMREQLSSLFSSIGNTVAPHGGACVGPNQQGQCP
jgi:pilus assembly protein Flp/PilA